MTACAGKQAVVVGGTQGIGLATARMPLGLELGAPHGWPPRIGVGVQSWVRPPSATRSMPVL